MKRPTILFTLLLLLLSSTVFFNTSAFAATTDKFYISVDPGAGTTDDVFTMSVVIEGLPHADTPYLVGGDDFEVKLVSGPNLNAQIINGLMSQQVVYVYELTPKKEGALKTPGAEVEVSGVTWKAPAVTIQVGTGQPAPSGARQPIFSRQSLEKKSVYAGEQLTYSLEVLSSQPVQQLQLVNSSFDGFWTEELGKQRQTKTSIGVALYDVYTIKRALYPLKEGQNEIEPRVFKAAVVQPRRRGSNPFGLGGMNPWDDSLIDQLLSHGEVRDVTVRSNPLSVEVKPLPALPKNFPLWNLTSAPVGKTEITASYSDDAIKIGGNKTLTVAVTSYGNLKSLTTPVLKLPDGVRSYDEAPQLTHMESGGKVIMKKIFTFSLVSLDGGDVHIPPLELGYFDPAEQRYEIARSGEIHFPVLGERKAPQAAPQTDEQPAVSAATPATPSLPVTEQYREETTLERLSSQVSPSLALLFFAIVLFLAVVIGLALRQRAANKPLIEIKRRLQDATTAQELDDALTAFLSLHLKRGGIAPPANELRAASLSFSSDSDTKFQLQTIFDTIDRLRFGGKSADPSEFQQLKDKLPRFLKTLS